MPQPNKIYDIPIYRVSFENDDGTEKVDVMLFDSTVAMGKIIERIFETFGRTPNSKKFTTVKIKRT